MELKASNITKSFGNKQVLKGISFSVQSGRALGLLGRNGAGKTTTIRILMDVFHASSGEITLDDNKFIQSEHQIGYLPEERGLYPKKPVNEQMIYLAMLRGLSKKEASENALKWLKKLGVHEYWNKKLETLSKGNQQKIQLASTLVCNPDIVILDEPFSGLDPVNSQILQDVVKGLISEGKIVIFSSHQMSYVEEFCEDIVIINKGEVALSGNLTEIKKEFGKSQWVLAALNKSIDELRNILINEYSDIVTITGVAKNTLILRLTEGKTSTELLKKLLDSDIAVEHFETYKPSLNDIFVVKAGDR